MRSQADTSRSQCHSCWLCVSCPSFPPGPLSDLVRSELLRTGITRILHLQSTWSLGKLWQMFSWGSPGSEPTSPYPEESFGMLFEPGFWQRNWGFSPPLSFRMLIWEFICFRYCKKVRGKVPDQRSSLDTYSLRLGLCLSSPNIKQNKKDHDKWVHFNIPVLIYSSTAMPEKCESSHSECRKRLRNSEV